MASRPGLKTWATSSPFATPQVAITLAEYGLKRPERLAKNEYRTLYDIADNTVYTLIVLAYTPRFDQRPQASLLSS